MELAKNNKFFKDNDVFARVEVDSRFGATVTLQSKPVAKSLIDIVKNLFAKPQIYSTNVNHLCFDDSAYFLAKNIREVKNNEKNFLDVFTKEN